MFHFIFLYMYLQSATSTKISLTSLYQMMKRSVASLALLQVIDPENGSNTTIFNNYKLSFIEQKTWLLLQRREQEN